MKLLATEFILPKPLEGRNCHASHCLPLPDGRVLAVWFEGKKEKAPDVCIYGSLRDINGRWGESYAITEDNGIAHWNPVLHLRGDGTIELYFKEGPEIPTWKTMVSTSRDGRTFTPATEMIPGDAGGRGPVRNKIYRLKSGRLAAPASLEDGVWRMFADLSDDEGKTWKKSEEVSLFKPSILEKLIYHKRGVIQPTFWESTPGHLHALLRSSEGRIYRVDSTDGGETWQSPYPTDLPNNNSGIDVAQLPDGTLLLVYNPVERNWGPRTPISYCTSTDNGQTWSAPEALCEEACELSYPAAVPGGDKVYVTYTHSRTNIAFHILEMR